MNVEQELENLCISTNKNNPIKNSKDNGTLYYQEFVSVINKLSKYIKDSDVRDILVNKLQLSKTTFDSENYYEYATELTVINYALELQPDSFYYEKAVNGETKKKPECTFYIKDFIYNLEAKCPYHENTKTGPKDGNTIFKLDSFGRAPNFQSLKDLQDFFNSDFKNANLDVSFEILKNNDNKLKDYLTSAHSKFSDFRNEKEVNVLFVALNDVHEMADFFKYLFANKGLFTEGSFCDPNNYSRVDIIVLTNSYFRHKNNEKINGSAWRVNDSFNLLFLNPHRQSCKMNAICFLDEILQNYTIDMGKYESTIDMQGSDLSIITEVRRAVLLQSYVKDKLEKECQKYLFYSADEK